MFSFYTLKKKKLKATSLLSGGHVNECDGEKKFSLCH
jgi:hypothetical protein